MVWFICCFHAKWWEHQNFVVRSNVCQFFLSFTNRCITCFCFYREPYGISPENSLINGKSFKDRGKSKLLLKIPWNEIFQLINLSNVGPLSSLRTLKFVRFSEIILALATVHWSVNPTMLNMNNCNDWRTDVSLRVTPEHCLRCRRNVVNTIALACGSCSLKH